MQVIVKKPKRGRQGEGGGRPSHKVTKQNRELVKLLASLGATQDDIAIKMEISDETLRKHYERELEIGRIDANFQVAGQLYKKARQGDNACMIFWLKTRGKWREVHDEADTNITVNVTGGLPD